VIRESVRRFAGSLGDEVNKALNLVLQGGREMKNLRMLFVFVLSVVFFASAPMAASGDQGAEYSPQGSGNVVIVIQSGDPDLVFYALLFAHRAIKHQWMDNVKIVFWGPAEKTLAGLPQDSEQVKLIKDIQAMGGKSARIWACKACSDKYGVTEQMEKLGFEVFLVGNATSYLIKLGYRIWNW
jgi:hypothetical protein